MVQTLQSHMPNWGVLPPKRVQSTTVKAILTGVGLAIAAAGVVSSFGTVFTAPVTAAFSGASHVVDRVKNHVEESDELTYRAGYYSAQIFKQLGIAPKPNQLATVEEFKLAASLNTQLKKYYDAPVAKAEKANRESLYTNAGMAAVGAFVPGGTVLKEVGGTALEVTKVAQGLHIVKTLAAGAAGMAAGQVLADVLSRNVVDPQSLLEGMHKALGEAQQKGINPRGAITPKLVFTLRVAQDPKFAQEIKQHFGENKRGFHQMSEQEQLRVMQAFPALANAATSEAHAISMGDLPVQELAAMSPNLNSVAAKYAYGATNTNFAGQQRPASFTDRVTASRAPTNAATLVQ